MFARVSRFQGEPPAADPTEMLRDQMLPALHRIDGFVGLLALEDPDSGRSLGITFWADQASMVASRSAADTLRRQSAREFGESIAEVSEYEVALHEMEGQ